MNGGWRPDPQYLDEYRGFVAQVVERYPEIVAVEAGNEPNLTPWWLPKPEPEYYTRYLKATYQGVKSIRPELPVLFGGLSPLVRDPAGPETGMSWQTFLERAYGAGAKQWFDGLGYHSYIISDQYASKLRLRMEWIDTLTRKHGDAGVPVWITETGYGTRGSGAVSEQQQATRLRTTHQIFSSYDRVEAVIFNRMFDIGDDYYGSTGLVTLNGALKASYCLLAIWRQTSPGRCS
jgi:hypothetical protein